jgi:hypothetical protein
MSDPIVTSSTTTPSPIEHWRKEVEALTEDARRILERVTKARRMYHANAIADDIAAAATPDHALPGTTMSAARAAALAATTDAVHGFMETVVDANSGMTVEDVLYKIWPDGTSETAP